MFDGKSILVTGGTGSFGQRFVETMLERYRPRRLIVYSRDELKQSEMASRIDSDVIRFFLGDVRDLERLTRAFYGVDYVVHAAALKQAPALEYNPTEAIKTNVLGAQNVIAAAIQCGVERVIALSTDKAANPINLYGATKFAADKLFIAANNIKGAQQTYFSVVRYGNVLNSRGSVVPIYREMIAGGATELPITDPKMTRFVITLEEGVDFVLASFERMYGAELFIPKIPSIKIVDLAKAMAPNAGLKVVGIRPGEKLHEVLVPGELSRLLIEYTDFYVLKPEFRYFHEVDYTKNLRGEQGKLLTDEFEYRSNTNPVFLDIEGIREKLKSI